MKKLFGQISLLIAVMIVAQIQAQISIKALPEKIFIESGRNSQIINFDFLISNSGSDTLELHKVNVSAFDSAGNILHTRFLDNNGTAPSVKMLPVRKWNGNESHLVFNPFNEFFLATAISQLEFEWTFENNAKKQSVVTTIVSPEKYVQKTNFLLPVKGRVLVYDAHDYTSHHRRFDYNFAPIKSLGILSNFMRYAYDFVIIDEKGKQHSQSGDENEQHYIFGKEICSVAAGKVIYAVANHKDDGTFNVPKLKENPLELYGNCIAIEHSPGVISVYGHLKENSILVKIGSSVKAGQPIAAAGTSGSSFFPHLHFEVRTSIGHESQGLPSYFNDLYLREGTKKIPLDNHAPETGSIIEAE